MEVSDVRDGTHSSPKFDVKDILMGMIGTIGNLAVIDKAPNFAIKNVALIRYLVLKM